MCSYFANVVGAAKRSQDYDDQDRFKRVERRGMLAAWVLNIGKIGTHVGIISKSRFC